MGDVLAHGPDRPSRRRRWVIPAGVVAAVAAVAFVVTRPDSAPPPSSAAPDGPQTSAPTASPRSSPSATPTDLQPWPSAAGACGSDASLPLLSVAPLRATTGLTVLVGGAGLRLVDVDTGAVRLLIAGGTGRGGQVTELAASPARVHAVRVRCEELMAPAGTVLTLNPRRLTVTTALAGRVDALLSGPDTAWGFTYPTDPAIEPMVLRPLDGAMPVSLPAGFEAAAATRQDFLGSVIRNGEQPADGGFDIAAVSRADPTDLRRIGRGYVVAATDRFGLTYRDCEPASTCALIWTRTRVGAAARTFPLPAGRALTSEVVLSANGRYAAFQLSRPDPDPRYDPGHPGGPSDLAVQDLRTGTLSVVPGVELAPKAAAGLAFSRDGRWLLIALNEGRRARLLVWRPGLDRPMESPARLPGRILYNVPVLDVSALTTATVP